MTITVIESILTDIVVMTPTLTPAILTDGMPLFEPTVIVTREVTVIEEVIKPGTGTLKRKPTTDGSIVIFDTSTGEEIPL